MIFTLRLRPRWTRKMRKERLAALWESQSATGEELGALLPSVLDKAFKGEL